MLKLKLFLFLGKFSKYFREMSEHYIITRIKNEIAHHLNQYENKYFEIRRQTYIASDNNHKIQIDIIYNKIAITPFSFSLLLQYNIDSDKIEKDIEIKSEIKSGKIIFEYFSHFENIDKISESLILQYFRRLNNGGK